MQDVSKVKVSLENYLSDYNLIHKSSLSLVVSDYLVDHVSRVCRVLKLHSGHVLLVGVTGSGRRSIVHLAAHVAGCELIKVRVFVLLYTVNIILTLCCRYLHGFPIGVTLYYWYTQVRSGVEGLNLPFYFG